MQQEDFSVNHTLTWVCRGSQGEGRGRGRKGGGDVEDKGITGQVEGTIEHVCCM